MLPLTISGPHTVRSHASPSQHLPLSAAALESSPPFTVLAAPRTLPPAASSSSSSSGFDSDSLLPDPEDLGCHRIEFKVDSVFKLNLLNAGPRSTAVPTDAMFLCLALPLLASHSVTGGKQQQAHGMRTASTAFEFVRLTGALTPFVAASLWRHQHSQPYPNHHLRCPRNQSAYDDSHASTQVANDTDAAEDGAHMCSCALVDRTRPSIPIGARAAVHVQPSALDAFLSGHTGVHTSDHSNGHSGHKNQNSQSGRSSGAHPAVLLCCDIGATQQRHTGDGDACVGGMAAAPMWGCAPEPDASAEDQLASSSSSSSSSACAASLVSLPPRMSAVLGYALIDLKPLAYGLKTIDGWCVNTPTCFALHTFEAIFFTCHFQLVLPSISAGTIFNPMARHYRLLPVHRDRLRRSVKSSSA
jgi:hypothetical protein